MLDILGIETIALKTGLSVDEIEKLSETGVISRHKDVRNRYTRIMEIKIQGREMTLGPVFYYKCTFCDNILRRDSTGKSLGREQYSDMKTYQRCRDSPRLIKCQVCANYIWLEQIKWLAIEYYKGSNSI
ncbi:MAG: hypothetical protein Q9M40_10885 [Sulfurimonas sp.]|nr:hypothetical protein [Sulfurimonas sp.]